MNGALHIGSNFDKTWWIWTADKYSASSAWVVYFQLGTFIANPVYYTGYVRAVR